MSGSPNATDSNPPLWGRALILWSLVGLASVFLLWIFAQVEHAADQAQSEIEGKRRVIDLTNSYAKRLESSIERIDQLSLIVARIASSGNNSVTHQTFQDLPSYPWFNPLLIDRHGMVC